MVINHGRWPHGSDWLCEATFECYLPLLRTIRRLVADGISPKWTINISAVLAEQLASPEYQRELQLYGDNLRRSFADGRAEFERQGDRAVVGLKACGEHLDVLMWELDRGHDGENIGAF